MLFRKPRESRPEVQKPAPVVEGQLVPGMHRTTFYIGFLAGCIAAIWFVLEIADSMKVLQ